MNIHDFCIICGDELKIDKQSIQEVTKHGESKIVHKWCIDKVIARCKGTNVV